LAAVPRFVRDAAKSLFKVQALQSDSLTSKISIQWSSKRIASSTSWHILSFEDVIKGILVYRDGLNASEGI